MLCQVLLPLVLLTITAATSLEPRRARQLDLGPPTNQISETSGGPRESSFQQPGYLPPIEPAGAQDDPVVLRPTTLPPARPTHHGRDLCTDPFHSFLCANLRTRRPITGALPNQRIIEADGNNLSGANTFLEPSKVLAPPLNDLEDPSTTTTRRPITTTYRTTTTRRPTTTTTTTTTPRPTTTRRPTTTTTTRRPTTTTTTTRRPTTTTTTTTTERPIGPEASNDVRSYLPPESIAPAAAQQDLTVVKPDSTDEEHHHHHPHHHGRDLCSDPFHSFLCQPLKPRKRITGDLPNGLQGQNTFLTPQKIRPDPDISPQPSNEIDRAYLPPATTTRRPTTTTTRRPIEPQPSNEIDNVYLPPVTTTRRPPPPPTTTRRPTTTTRRPTTIRFRPEPSNDIERAYLPPSTTRRPPPPPPTTRRPPPPPPTTTRRPTTTTQRPTTTIRFRPEPSNEVERAYLPPVAPQPSNIDNNYLRPEPKIEPAAAQNDPAIAAPDHDHHHHHGSHGFKDICSDPFHSFLCTVPKPRTRITGALPDRFRNNILSPAPSNIDLSRVRILEHKSDNLKILVVPQDSQAPQPSQQQDTKIPPPGYSLTRPENKLTLPSETKEVIGYNYPKPTSPAPTTTKGYSYPKPEKKLTLPSEIVDVRITPRARPTTTTTVGYSYPKPEKKLTLPSEVRPQVVTGYNYPKPTTTPGYDYPTPLNKFNLPSESKQVVGYDYPKPAKGYEYPTPEVKLPLPSEIKPVIGYDYPKPTVGLPEPTKGYDYPKPELKLTLPSENKPVRLPEPTKGYDYPKPELKLTLPSENKPVVGYDYPKPSVGLPEPTKGYDYPKPDNRLTLPSEQSNAPRQKPTLSSPSQNRSPQPYRPSPNPQSQSRNALPSSLKEARERLQGLQGTKVDKISNISNQNSVSDLIPVNQVEFPSDGGLSVRFGERLKRRERKSYLSPPPGSHRL